MDAVLDYARRVGGPALRRLTFHQRADLLKRLAQHLNAHREVLYRLSFDTGATRSDHLIDIDGGIGTLFVFASKAKRELPDATFLLDGPVEALSKGGSFVGRHILTSLHGTAIHINAYNFPCWGLLEKLAPAILAGMPVVTKPATVTAYVAHALVRLIDESGLLPPGALQCVVGPTGDLFDHLTGQDVVSFTARPPPPRCSSATRSSPARRCASSPSATRSTPRSSGPTPRPARRNSTCSSRRSPAR